MEGTRFRISKFVFSNQINKNLQECTFSTFFLLHWRLLGALSEFLGVFLKINKYLNTSNLLVFSDK
jgi:hypothetical protein